MTLFRTRIIFLAFVWPGLASARMGQLAPGQLAAGPVTTEPLTVEQAVEIGLQRNPQVAGGAAGVDAARASYRALATLNPLTLGATHVQGTSTGPTLNSNTSDTFLDLSETIDTSGQRRFQAAGANSTFRSARFQFQETLLGLEQQIRDAYWSLAAAQAQVRVADLGLREAQRVFDLVVKQVDAGASPRADAIRSSVDVANAKQTLITAQGAEKSAMTALNTLLARSPTSPTPLADRLDEATAAPDVAQESVETLIQRALVNRPLLKSSAEQVRAAGYAVEQAGASRFPDLTVDYEKSLQDPSVAAFLATVSFPLVDFGSVRESIKASRAARRQSEAQHMQTEQQVDQQVVQAHDDLATALLVAASYRKEILEPSATLVDMARLGYSEGLTGILPVLDAEATVRNARVGFINALLAVYKGQDEVLAAIGRPAVPDAGTPLAGTPRGN